MITVNFQVLAGHQSGYGHIVRCIALAQELTSRGCRCRFHGNDAALERALAHGFGAVPEDDYADVWICDLEHGTPPSLAKHYRERCRVLTIINGVGYKDLDEGRLLADIVLYCGVTQRPDELNWDGFDGWWGASVEWLIIRDSFLLWRNDSIVRAMIHQPDLPPRVVVAAGGSDPKNITQSIVSSFLGVKSDVKAIIGPSNDDPGGVIAGRPVYYVIDPPNMAREMAWADVAVVSYGMTAFECLCLGIPTVALSISPDHAASAALVQEQSGGALVSLGEVENVHPVDIRDAVQKQLADAPALSQKARQYVDGKGVYRVAEKIMEVLKCEG